MAGGVRECPQSHFYYSPNSSKSALVPVEAMRARRRLPICVAVFAGGPPLVKLEIGFLQQAFPCMALENVCVPDVIPERVHALVARLIGRLEDRGTARGSAGQKA